MTKKIFLLTFIIYHLAFNISIAQAPRSYTSSEVLLQLKKLNTVGSVLYIAAHPDDENTRLLAYLANEKCLRSGYLSLTRGDGGQNLIGSEQGVELGIIRTQELLAARRIDGAEQFFTRAYDFGYSKTPKETFEKWNHDSVLGDVVWVIRNFRPDIIITRFATDGSGGHGHHTASAILAEEAFDAAGDPKRFPEQLKYVDVWQPRRLFYNSAARFFNPNADISKLIKLDVGGYNPLLGKSYGEIAAESRSMHRSQGFGSAKQRGESFEYFKPIKGDTANLKDIFDGIDFSWNRVKGSGKVGEMITKIVKDYKVENPENSMNDIGKTFKYTLDEFRKKNYWSSIDLETKLYALSSKCSGIFIEVVCNTFNYCHSDSVELIINIVNRSHRQIKILHVDLPEIENHYIGDKSGYISIPDTFIQPNKMITTKVRFKSKNEGKIGNLFWLEKNIKSNLFSYDTKMKQEYTYQNPSLKNGLFSILCLRNNKEDEAYTIEVPTNIQYKWVDPSRGELYRPLVITPPVMINLEEKSMVFADEKEKVIKIIVKAGKDNVQTKVKLELPQGWKSEPSEINSQLSKKGEEQIIQFKITPPVNSNAGIMKVTAIVDGIEYSKSIKEIKYDHIPIQTWFPDAEVKLVRLDIVKKLKRIGYIPGAGDEVIPCLTQLGYEVITLTDDMIGKENLSQFDAIITGVRAYNVNDKLPSFKQKLMDYVSNGGNLIVQYNTNNFISQLSGNFGPYPFKVSRDRVTDENAKVNFELPNHPVLNTPNKITDKDFEGWIQERCIYTASDTIGNYEMPLSMSDAGEKPNKGSLIIAKHGKGNFIYTGLVFFRELPAGVPGAYRLFVNLIELGK